MVAGLGAAVGVVTLLVGGSQAPPGDGPASAVLGLEPCLDAAGIGLRGRF
ncbi:MAG: hypothetical protein HY744_26650 [Deltaproteobacteria bacterium]|nr:hypothetical protein [Deltaproteobacteria bacterium]